METVIDNTSVKKYPAYKDSGAERRGRTQRGRKSERRIEDLKPELFLCWN